MDTITLSHHGQNAKAEVLKRNPKNCKVKLLEPLGKFPVGCVINAPHSMCGGPQGASPAAPVAPKRQMPDYRSPFFPSFDRHLIAAISCLHSQLSPENLHCDGERPAAEAHRLGVALRRKLAALEAVLGYSVDESEGFEAVQHWAGEKRFG